MEASTSSGMAAVPTIEASHTTQTNFDTKDHLPHLPQELWTLILSHVPYAELWSTCRNVSRTFKANSNFILRNYFIAKEISLGHSGTYLTFSHFEGSKGTDVAYFKPAEIPPPYVHRLTIQNLIKISNKNNRLSIIHGLPNRLLVRIGTWGPWRKIGRATIMTQHVRQFAVFWLTDDTEAHHRLGFIRKDGTMSLNWRRLCMKHLHVVQRKIAQRKLG
jgi:hypothetical protein